jgi:hypothetical protein
MPFPKVVETLTIGKRHIANHAKIHPGKKEQRQMSLKRPIRLIDAFSGCGGMTLGFAHLPIGKFAPVWANDWNRYAGETYNANLVTDDRKRFNPLIPL